MQGQRLGLLGFKCSLTAFTGAKSRVGTSGKGGHGGRDAGAGEEEIRLLDGSQWAWGGDKRESPGFLACKGQTTSSSGLEKTPLNSTGYLGWEMVFSK